MNYDIAPMEGLTDSIYRRLHHAYFPGADRYYTPFFSPTVHRALTNREQRELPLAWEEGFSAVPQILTKSSQDFLWLTQVCADRGYSEVNLNLGCPSSTVVSKGKGSGMLRTLDSLDKLLEEIYAHAPLPISVKTRLGLESGEEFYPLLQIFNRYPIAELIIHPRVRKQFYDGDVDMEVFGYAYGESKNPVSYNGDLKTRKDILAVEKVFPNLRSIMVGRGVIADPGLLSPQPANAEKLEAFMDALLDAYTQAFGSHRNAMFRLKENWHYIAPRFDGSERLWKQLRKTTDFSQYKAVSAEIFRTLPLKP